MLRDILSHLFSESPLCKVIEECKHFVDSTRRAGTREGGGQRRERRRDILAAAATAERAADPVHRLHPRIRAGPGSEDHEKYPAGAEFISRGDRLEAARDLRGVGHGLD